jgi:choline-glycine betaine transporter
MHWPFTLPALLVLGLIGACAAWSSKTERGRAAFAAAGFALAAWFALVALTLFQLSSDLAAPSPIPTTWSEPTTLLFLVLLPCAVCHFVCQLSLRRGKRRLSAIAISVAAGVSALVVALPPAYLISCTTSGECA